MATALKVMKSGHGDRPFYPSDQILCILSSKSYEDDPKHLPDGWTILEKEKKSDSYFGAVFFNEEFKQLVISHRGTDFFSAKDWWADFDGVVQNNYTSQFDSACNFVFHVLKTYQDQCRSISITGHSLGGWLSQSTVFAIEYLTPTGNGQNKFRRLEPAERKWHPHAVVFDSPGGHEILCELSNTYFHKYEETAHDLVSPLDITTYVIAPNLVNATNQHVGRIISFNSVPNLAIWENLMPHTYQYHRLENFVKAFENIERVPKFTVLDWPKFGGIWNKIKKKCGLPKADEYEKFFEHADRRGNNFHPFVEHLNKEKINVHYKTEEFKENVANGNVFTENERIFLESWEKLKIHNINPEVLNKFLSSLGSFDNLLPNFEISEGRQIVCDNKDELNRIINQVKWLFAYSPKASDIMKEQISKTPKVYEAMYMTAMYGYLQTLPNYHVEFQDNIGLGEFLRSGDFHVTIIKTNNTKDEAYRINSILQSMREYKGRFCIFSYKDLKYLEKHVDMFSVFASSSTIDDVLVIDFGDEENLDVVRQFYNKIVNGVSKKIVCIVAKDPTLVEFAHMNINKDISLMDLAGDHLNSLLNQNLVSLSGSQMTLNDFKGGSSLGTLSDSIPFDLLKTLLLSSKVEEVKFENEHCNQVFLNLTTTKVPVKQLDITSLQDLLENYESTLRPIIGKSIEHIKFFITGVDNEALIWDNLDLVYRDNVTLKSSTDLDESSKLYRHFCLDNPKMTIFRLHMSEDHTLNWIDTFNPDLYVERNFIMKDCEGRVKEEELLKRTEQMLLISNDAGMGKSTTLWNLARRIQTGWKFWINLQDAHKYTDASISIDSVVDFLLKFSNNSSQLAKYLLKFSLTHEDSTPVHLFFDAFDEIQDVKTKRKLQLQNEIIEILQFLKNNTSAKIFISTRSYEYDRYFLEEKVNTSFRFSVLEEQVRKFFENVTTFNLKQVTEEEQLDFCTKFWLSRLCLTNFNNLQLEEELNSYARTLLEKVKNTIDKSTLSILGIPLLLKIISEIFQPESMENIVLENFTFNLYELYSKFEDKKYKIYFEEKMCFIPEAIARRVADDFKAEHKILALNHFFPILRTEINLKKVTDLNRIGLVQISDNVVNFVHQTFAEFFAAKSLIDRFENALDKYAQYIMVTLVLAQQDYTVIRRFLNDMFVKEGQKGDVLKFLPSMWLRVNNCSVCNSSPAKHYFGCKYTILQTCVDDNNSKLLDLILKTFNSFNENENLKNDLINALLSDGNTALHRAIESFENLKIASTLLNYGPDLFIQGQRRDTYFHLSASKPCFNDFTVRLLQKAGAEAHRLINPLINVNRSNRKLKDPWVIAFKNRNWDLFFKIYKLMQANQSFRSEWGVRVLCMAAEMNEIELAIHLIDQRVGFDDRRNDFPLDTVVGINSFLEYGRWNLIKMLIKMKFNAQDAEYAKQLIRMEESIWRLVLEKDVTATNEKDQTFLHFAIGQGKVDIATKLIENGADINFRDQHKKSPAYLAATLDNWDFILSHMDKLESEVSEPPNRKLLHLACERNQPDVALRLITTGKRDPNMVDVDERFPLSIAAEKEHWELMSKLLDQEQVEVDVTADETPLHEVCKHNQIDLAVKLIKKIDINSTDLNKFWPPLLEAADEGHWLLVSKLINLGASVTVKNHQKQTLLHFACRDNQINLALDLAANDQINVNSPDIVNDTPLLLAAENGHWDLVTKLIKPNFSVDGSNHYGQTLLYFACQDNQSDLALMLINSKADLNLADKIGHSSPLVLAAEKDHWGLIFEVFKSNSSVTSSNKGNLLHIACKKNKLQAALKLIQLEAEINYRDKFGETPLLTAASQGHWNLVYELINFKADVTIPNNNNQNIFHFSCRDNKLDLVENLIEKFKDKLNFQERGHKKTAIMYAAQNGHWELVEKLIEFEANFTLEDALKNTILHYACRDNQVEIALMLIKEGCDVELINKSGDSPWKIALESGHVDLLIKIEDLIGKKFLE